MNPSKKQTDLLALANKGGNDATLLLLDKIHELEDKMAQLEQDVKKDAPEDVKVERTAMRLAAKLATLEKGDQGDIGPAGESIVGPPGPPGKDSTVPGPKGDKGDTGPVGNDGIDGADGKDAVFETSVPELYNRFDSLRIKLPHEVSSGLSAVLNAYPVTQNVLETVRSSTQLIRRHKKGEYASFDKTTGGEKDVITISEPQATNTFHEVIHAYLANSSNKPDLQSFQTAFGIEKPDSPMLQLIDQILETDSQNYPPSSKRDLPEERFAYVAEAYGAGGLYAIPERLQEFYQNMIEPLGGVKRLTVSDLEAKIKAIPERPTTTIFGPGKTKIFTADLSSLLDGSTKTFFVGTHFGIISVNSSGAPFGSFRPTTDYNEVGKNIVFTSSVDAPSALPSGGSLVVRYLK